MCSLEIIVLSIIIFCKDIFLSFLKAQTSHSGSSIHSSNWEMGSGALYRWRGRAMCERAGEQMRGLSGVQGEFAVFFPKFLKHLLVYGSNFCRWQSQWICSPRPRIPRIMHKLTWLGIMCIDSCGWILYTLHNLWLALFLFSNHNNLKLWPKLQKNDKCSILIQY